MFEYVDRTYHDDLNLCTANCTTSASHTVEAAGQKPPDTKLMGVMAFPNMAYEDIKKNAQAGHPAAQAFEMIRSTRTLYEKDPDGSDRLDDDGNPLPSWTPKAAR